MSFQIKFFKMVIVMMVITGSFSMPAFVQADEFEPPPTASAPNASVMPIPANPRTWCEEEGYCSPGETTTTVVIDDDPPPPTAWRIVVNATSLADVKVPVSTARSKPTTVLPSTVSVVKRFVRLTPFRLSLRHRGFGTCATRPVIGSWLVPSAPSLTGR
ncbi:MAG: hypothetical protein H6759_04470 [Candidatus Nomurabacteria bacterium]|nr:MAG: hypothetical protein H6759_04470 [Candidatus Nomurabacteria bacterium]